MRRLRVSPMPKQSWDQLVSDHPEFAEAVAFFRERLGDDCIRKGTPFASTFATTFQDGVPEGVRIRRLVRTLGSAPGLDELVRSLGGEAEHEVRGTEMTLRMAAAWTVHGRAVRFVPRTRDRTADLTVDLAARSVTVECTCLNENEDDEAVGEFVRYTMNWAEQQPGRLEGEFLAGATVEDLETVRALLEELRRAPESLDRVVNGVVRVAYDPAGEQNFFPFMTAPPSRANDLARVLGKLKKKVTQFVPGEPNVLAIDVGDVFDLHEVLEIRRRTCDALRRYKRISAVVLVQTDLRACHAARRWSLGHFEGPTDAGLLRRGLLVHNPEGTTRLTWQESRAFEDAVFA